MPPSIMEKALVGVAGAAGVGVLAWQTQFPWIKYDWQIIQFGRKLMKEQEQLLGGFLVDKFEVHVANHPQKAMIIYEDCVYTYEFMDQQANRVANAARALGLKCLDSVAMMVHNEPAFAWTLLGLQKLGVSVALINFNLRLKPLSHSVLASEPKAFFVGAGEDLIQAAVDVMDDLGGVPLYVQGLNPGPGQAPSGVRDFDALMTRALPIRPDRSVRADLTPTSVMSYIYTSGTTGLPKPVFITQTKANAIGTALMIADICAEDIIYTVLPLYHSAGGGIGLYGIIQKGLPKPVIINQRKGNRLGSELEIAEFCAEDIVYTILPLYHSAGGGLGLFGVIQKGATMVLRSKFSATHFWDDCRKYNVTIVQYIGEIFRYILAQPPHELDKVHKVRAAFGNGLRKDIFEQVLERYKIPHIFEFFGATEGTSMLINMANRPGAIGRCSPFLNLIDPEPKVLVKFDYSTAMPVRDKNGRCTKCKPGEVGLFLSKVPDMILQAGGGNLTVYKASKESNEKKIVRDAFKEGDMYFNYGDVFLMDKDYFVYFHDRIGDTFRWKGENVSTTEVANVVSLPDFIHDANVYGVSIPGHDGRCGMAALTLNDGEQITSERLKEVYKVCQGDLPSYARPLFLRVLPEAVLTGTFKQRKVELVEEGYDATKVKDALYYLDAKAGTYSPLSAQGLASFLQSRL